MNHPILRTPSRVYLCLSMRYIGSKAWCVDALGRLIDAELPNCTSLCDPFAGTCTVPRYFKSKGLRVVTGDALRLSFAFQVAVIRLNRPPRFARLLQDLAKPLDVHRASPVDLVLSALNAVPGRRGWVTKNFSPAGRCQRRFFTQHNARRLDAVRLTIRRWRRAGLVNRYEHEYLMACLLDAADRVANTAGTYYAFLRTFYRKAKNPLTLRRIPVVDNAQRNQVFCADARSVVASTAVDVLYLDPPYNNRDYGAYYHFPELLAHDLAPAVVGRSGRPSKPSSRSDFCSPGKAAMALGELVRRANARLIVLHYAENGLISHGDILAFLRNRGRTRWTTWRSRPYASNPYLEAPSPACLTRVYVCHTS